jgi:hypothetical protein
VMLLQFAHETCFVVGLATSARPVPADVATLAALRQPPMD